MMLDNVTMSLDRWQIPHLPCCDRYHEMTTLTPPGDRSAFACEHVCSAEHAIFGTSCEANATQRSQKRMREQRHKTGASILQLWNQLCNEMCMLGGRPMQPTAQGLAQMNSLLLSTCQTEKYYYHWQVKTCAFTWLESPQLTSPQSSRKGNYSTIENTRK